MMVAISVNGGVVSTGKLQTSLESTTTVPDSTVLTCDYSSPPPWLLTWSSTFLLSYFMYLKLRNFLAVNSRSHE